LALSSPRRPTEEEEAAEEDQEAAAEAMAGVDQRRLGAACYRLSSAAAERHCAVASQRGSERAAVAIDGMSFMRWPAWVPFDPST